MKGNPHDVPSFVRGRKGRTSLVDCLVSVLWKSADGTDPWPERSFKDLQEKVSKLQGYPVTGSTIRSSIYAHSDLFERVRSGHGALLWRLSKKARHA